MSDPMEHWSDFITELKSRAEAGRRYYGDKSFARPPQELWGELRQEAADFPGWAWVIWDVARRTGDTTTAERARLVGLLGFFLWCVFHEWEGSPAPAICPVCKGAGHEIQKDCEFCMVTRVSADPECLEKVQCYCGNCWISRSTHFGSGARGWKNPTCHACGGTGKKRS